jgi:hypothetical protein
LAVELKPFLVGEQQESGQHRQRQDRELAGEYLSGELAHPRSPHSADCRWDPAIRQGFSRFGSTYLLS